MALAQPITETLILYLQNGVSLDGASKNPAAVQTFIQLTNTLKAQKGFLGQLWGPQVENPNIFVWSIDWESLEHHTAFIKSEGYNSFKAGFSHVFDLKEAPPLSLYTRWTSAADAALKAPVTEVSFLSLPKAADEETKTIVDDALKPILETVKAVGKAWGSAVGWVIETMPQSAVVSQSGGQLLHGVFGYASIDDHMKWREQPEIRMAREIFEDLERRNLSLRSASVPGVDPDTGYFHVKFRAEM